MSEITAMLALGALSWLLRVAFVLVLPAHRLPRAVIRGLEHLAPAILASICAVELCSVTRGGSIVAGSAAVGLIAGAGLVAYWIRNLTVTVFCGLLGVLLLDLVLL